MDLKIMNYCYYSNQSSIEKYNAPVLILFCRDKDKNFHQVYVCDKENLAPEMYIELGEWDKFYPSWMENKEMYPIVDWANAPDSNYGEETVVLYTTFPWQVNKLKKMFTHTYMSDLKWEKMCIEKMGLKTPYIEVPDNYKEGWLKVSDIKELPEERQFYVHIKWIAWDIETNAAPIFPNFSGYKDAETCDIISISAYDNYTKEYHRFFWHEKTSSKEVHTQWKRKGTMFVPALNKEKEYDKSNVVITHHFDNEIDMLKAYFKWFSEIKPDAQMGFNSEGGYRISTRKGSSKKYWFNGYDMPFLYHRTKTLKILKEIQKMSPLPNHVKGVKFRVNGEKTSVAIEGVCQIDFIYTNEIFGYHKKFDKFREGNLQGYMSFFLGFGKVEHKEQIWEMWKDNVKSDYDPSGPDNGVKKQKNLIKELFNEAKNETLM